MSVVARPNSQEGMCSGDVWAPLHIKVLEEKCRAYLQTRLLRNLLHRVSPDELNCFPHPVVREVEDALLWGPPDRHIGDPNQ